MRLDQIQAPPPSGQADTDSPSSTESSGQTKPLAKVHPYVLPSNNVAQLLFGIPLVLLKAKRQGIVYASLLLLGGVFTGLTAAPFSQPNPSTCCHPSHLTFQVAMRNIGPCNQLKPFGLAHPGKRSCEDATMTYYAMLGMGIALFAGAAGIAVWSRFKLLEKRDEELKEWKKNQTDPEDIHLHIKHAMKIIEFGFFGELLLFGIILMTFFFTAERWHIAAIVVAIVLLAAWWHFLVPNEIKKKHGNKHHGHLLTVLAMAILISAVLYELLITLPIFYFWNCCKDSDGKNCRDRTSSCPRIGLHLEHLPRRIVIAYCILGVAVALVLLLGLLRVTVLQKHWTEKMSALWKPDRSHAAPRPLPKKRLGAR